MKFYQYCNLVDSGVDEEERMANDSFIHNVGISGCTSIRMGCIDEIEEYRFWLYIEYANWYWHWLSLGLYVV